MNDEERPASVARLLRAIHYGGDFPAMAQTVDVINSMTSSESTSSEALAETILQDFGLTQKLLRHVNTLAYNQYGEVTTITRAVLLMGFDRIRTLATTLILFEHFPKQARCRTGQSKCAGALAPPTLCGRDGRQVALSGFWQRPHPRGGGKGEHHWHAQPA
jgi:hypothetical protein